MRKMFFCLMAMMGVLPLSAQSIYDFTVKDDAGKECRSPSTRVRCC